MSTTVSVNNEGTSQNTLKEVTRDDSAWNAIGEAIGYPASWMSSIRDSLAKQGKSWKWSRVQAVTELSQVQREEQSTLRGGNALLIINSKTPFKTVRDSLLLAEQTNGSISVIYTEKLPLISEAKTSAEADEEFTVGLEAARKALAAVEREAKSLGVKAETAFVWSNSSKEILKRNNGRVDLVIDETA